MVEEATPVDLKAFEKRIGAARLSFGKAELLQAVLGVRPGSVTPLALINAAPGLITVALDADLMAAETVNFHPLRNDATTALSPADLLIFLRDLGHQPVILAFRDLAGAPI